ncbi:N-acetylmuramoyl-L-alanine amidase [Mucilaginibacter mali]|uniref:N-acetylmuramoyl-L-alanine amidase n=1 Tax=Mucilaginibacter mali TaxID=2740462 RepID=A0A7D4QHE6_9SPHI|nr:N-acetylmuramoyl-L-alanine amidase [Mucilaginibacter mali]QKJ28290.1 N-acetylmuramoyl-L-alanine amidase [Mucilaginibacter mali]
MPHLYLRHKLITCLGFILLLVSIAHAQGTKEIPGFKFKTVVIDAGHGGKDPGSHGEYTKEKTVALGIALKLRDAINEAIPSLNVIMTRTTDKFVELQQRAEIANNAKANLFISIHCNSSPQKVGTRRGALLLVYGLHRKGEQLEALRENSAIYQEKDYAKKYQGYKDNDPAYFITLNMFMQTYRAQSIKFGKLVSREIADVDNRRSEGVIEQGILVLAHSAMPSVMVETGFINNPADEKYLSSEEGQMATAKSILRALKKYRKGFEQD